MVPDEQSWITSTLTPNFAPVSLVCLAHFIGFLPTQKCFIECLAHTNLL